MLALFTLLAGVAMPVAAVGDARVSETYGKLPLHFEANRGQTHADVRFLARGPGYSLYLTPGEVVLLLARPNPDRKRNWHHDRQRRAARAQVISDVIRMNLMGAAPAPLVTGLDELHGKANYFIGNDPAQWRTNVPTYAKVQYRNVYPGIDLVYYGNQRQLEYDFIVAPGADPKKIVLGFKGADKLAIDAQGELVLHAAGGAIRQHKPVIYQEMDGVRTEIEGGYVLKGAKRVGFQVAAYDHTRPLVIDPVLSYSTYLAGSGHDAGRGIAVDAAGNAYVTGLTLSNDFPTTPGAFQTTLASGSTDVFVTRFNPTGSGLVYSTYLGGNSFDEEAFGIAVDVDGNAYVTGWTNSGNFPTTPGSFQPTGGGDAFVTKLDPTGSALVYSTYLGGSGGDRGLGIAVDAAKNAYVTGYTDSTNFPTSPGAFQTTFAGGGFYGTDVFVTKLNPTGSGLVYSTFLGGSDDDLGHGIAVDADGNAYVTGFTASTDFPTTSGVFQSAHAGGSAHDCCGGGPYDAFVTKLNPAGSGLVYSTYLGGSSVDVGIGIAVDASGHAYVTGYTGSSNLPITPGAFQSAFAGSYDAFATKLNPAGSGLVYSSYLGGIGSDVGLGIAVDAGGNAYVTGNTNSPNFPTTPGAFQPTFVGGNFGGGGDSSGDGFVTKIGPTGSFLVYSSFLGGSNFDEGRGIAVDAADNAYVTGVTNSPNFPTTPGGFQPAFVGGFSGPFTLPDAFVAKITDVTQTTSPSTPFTGTPIPVPGGFEAEDFDLGGEGVAYHDNVPGNAGGEYRPAEDVDIIGSSDSAGGGYVVHNFETGEWLAYTINVQTAALYDIELRVSSAFYNSAFHIEIDGRDVTGTVIVPNTGSWSAFQWVGKKGVSLIAGQHVLKIVTDQQYFDLNSIRVLPTPTTTRSEESAASYSGSWGTYGSEQGSFFSGGTIAASNYAGSTATFHFTGTAVTWIGVKCNVCGIATVSIDGGPPTTVNTAGPGAPGRLTSEPVFSASDLDPAVPHTLVITVTGETTSGGYYIAVDAFDVTR